MKAVDRPAVVVGNCEYVSKVSIRREHVHTLVAKARADVESAGSATPKKETMFQKIMKRRSTPIALNHIRAFRVSPLPVPSSLGVC